MDEKKDEMDEQKNEKLYTPRHKCWGYNKGNQKEENKF